MSGTRQHIEDKTTKTRSYEQWKNEVDRVDAKINKIESGEKLNITVTVIEVQGLIDELVALKDEGDDLFTVNEDQAVNTTHADLFSSNPDVFNYLITEAAIRETLGKLNKLLEKIKSQKKPEQANIAKIKIEVDTQKKEVTSQDTVLKKEIPLGKIQEWRTIPPTRTSAKDRDLKSKIDACDEYAKHLKSYIEKEVNQLNDYALAKIATNHSGEKALFAQKQEKIDSIQSLFTGDLSRPFSHESETQYDNLSVHFHKCGKHNVAMAVEKYKLVYELKQSKDVEAFNIKLATHAPLLIKHRDSGTKRFLKGVGFAASVVASVATLGIFTPLAYLAYDRFYGYSKTHGARFVNEVSKDARKQQQINATRKKNK